MPIVRKRIYLGTYAVIDFGYKVTNSSPLTHKLTSKRLYFNYFKEQLDHFNGTAMNSIISSLHGWPGFPLYVEFEGRSIRCHEARLDFANSIFELDGTYKDTTECASYSCTLSYRDKSLIKKLLRAYFLNNIVFQSQFLQKLSFSAYSNLSDYMKNGYLSFKAYHYG